MLPKYHMPCHAENKKSLYSSNSRTSTYKQRYKDSNLEMTESESVALPFGDSPKSYIQPLFLATNAIV